MDGMPGGAWQARQPSICQEDCMPQPADALETIRPSQAEHCTGRIHLSLGQYMGIFAIGAIRDSVCTPQHAALDPIQQTCDVMADCNAVGVAAEFWWWARQLPVDHASLSIFLFQRCSGVFWEVSKHRLTEHRLLASSRTSHGALQALLHGSLLYNICNT